MICAHTSIVQPRKGAEATCIQCKLDIIFDGTKWVWAYGIDKDKRSKLIRMFAIDQATGAH